MNIPNEFKIAGGKTIKVIQKDILKDGRFGDFSPARNEIELGRKVEEEDEVYNQTDEDMGKNVLS